MNYLSCGSTIHSQVYSCSLIIHIVLLSIFIVCAFCDDFGPLIDIGFYILKACDEACWKKRGGE